jgi:hypothetical protein
VADFVEQVREICEIAAPNHIIIFLFSDNKESAYEYDDLLLTASNDPNKNRHYFFPQFPHPADIDLQVFVLAQFISFVVFSSVPFIRVPRICFCLPPPLNVKFFDTTILSIQFVINWQYN